MIATQRVVVANDAAALRSVFVILEDVEGQVSKFSVILLDIQYIRVQIKILIAIWISSQELLKPVNGNIILLRNIACMSYLIHNIYILLKVSI